MTFEILIKIYQQSFVCYSVRSRTIDMNAVYLLATALISLILHQVNGYGRELKENFDLLIPFNISMIRKRSDRTCLQGSQQHN